MTALHLRIVEFKFTHKFVICDRLLDTEIIFGIDIQKIDDPESDDYSSDDTSSDSENDLN